jgi:hypothetical protein
MLHDGWCDYNKGFLSVDRVRYSDAIHEICLIKHVKNLSSKIEKSALTLKN